MPSGPPPSIQKPCLYRTRRFCRSGGAGRGHNSPRNNGRGGYCRPFTSLFPEPALAVSPPVDAWLSCRICLRRYSDRKIRDSRCPDRKSTRLNSSHVKISYAVFCLKKKKKNKDTRL